MDEEESALDLLEVRPSWSYFWSPKVSVLAFLLIKHFCVMNRQWADPTFLHIGPWDFNFHVGDTVVSPFWRVLWIGCEVIRYHMYVLIEYMSIQFFLISGSWQTLHATILVSRIPALSLWLQYLTNPSRNSWSYASLQHPICKASNFQPVSVFFY